MSESWTRLSAQLAAHSMHAKHSAKETTRAGSEAFEARFAHEVDPEDQLPQADRQRRAEHARKAYFTRLALKSAQARRQRG